MQKEKQKGIDAIKAAELAEIKKAKKERMEKERTEASKQSRERDPEIKRQAEASKRRNVSNAGQSYQVDFGRTLQPRGNKRKKKK